MRKLALLALTSGLLVACGNRSSEAKMGDLAPAAAPTAEMSAAPGVDLSKLGEGEKKIFFRAGQKLASACGKPHSLLTSAKTDPSCRRSTFALRMVARLAGEGFLESEIVERVERRYTQKQAQLDLANAPTKGDPKAPVTLVEFADFECPHCRLLQPLIDRLLE